MAGPGPAPRLPTDHARRRRSRRPATSSRLAVRSGGFGWHRCPDPAHPMDRRCPGSGDPKVATRGRLNPSNRCDPFLSDNHGFVSPVRATPSRPGVDAVRPMSAILSTGLTVGSYARSGCCPANSLGSFARFSDSSADLVGSFRRFRCLNGAHWVRFATAAAPSSAAVIRHFGRSWVRFANFEGRTARIGCRYGSVGFVSRRLSHY
jgi:hypothetical protein